MLRTFAPPVVAGVPIQFRAFAVKNSSKIGRLFQQDQHIFLNVINPRTKKQRVRKIFNTPP